MCNLCRAGCTTLLHNLVISAGHELTTGLARPANLTTATRKKSTYLELPAAPPSTKNKIHTPQSGLQPKVPTYLSHLNSKTFLSKSFKLTDSSAQSSLCPHPTKGPFITASNWLKALRPRTGLLDHWFWLCRVFPVPTSVLLQRPTLPSSWVLAPWEFVF